MYNGNKTYPTRVYWEAQTMDEKGTYVHDKKERPDEEKKKLLNRLKRIEGQIRGIENMVEKDSYCPEIVVQVSAVNSALNSFNKELLARHIRGCVADDIRNGNDDTIEELVRVLQKVMK